MDFLKTWTNFEQIKWVYEIQIPKISLDLVPPLHVWTFFYRVEQKFGARFRVYLQFKLCMGAIMTTSSPRWLKPPITEYWPNLGNLASPPPRFICTRLSKRYGNWHENCVSCLLTPIGLESDRREGIWLGRDVLMICLLVFYPKPLSVHTPSLSVWHITFPQQFHSHYWAFDFACLVAKFRTTTP